jgi:hypothetical protein
MTAPPAAERDGRALPPIAAGLPWPNVRGKRCLDLWAVAPLADELERRGAAEVVTLAVGDGTALLELDAARVGRFDVVACPGLLSGAADPLGALKHVHAVADGMLLSAEPIALWRSLVGRGRPWSAPDGAPRHGAASAFNAAGHKQLLEDAGFAVERASRAYAVPGAGGADAADGLVGLARRAVLRAVTGSWADGVVHRALLARRRP